MNMKCNRIYYIYIILDICIYKYISYCVKMVIFFLNLMTFVYILWSAKFTVNYCLNVVYSLGIVFLVV
jgi:hypothetical protein